jgi:cell division protein FtsI/penicillin-binding protein 2
MKEDPKNISDKLAPLLADETNDQKLILDEESRIYSLLTKENTVWVPLKHKVSEDIKKNIQALDIPGIGWEPEEKRYYPEASSAAHLLGFVGKNESGEDIGYFGLEGYYDLVLTGKPGFMEREEDVLGSPIMVEGTKEIGAIGGVDLVTYIDKTVQLTAERELKKGIKRYGAASGTVIVIDPKTGGIMAMSSEPSFEPAKYWEYGNEFFLNPAISLSFEPGSVFKVIIMSSALDAGVVEPDTRCDVCTGPFKVDKYSIQTWNNKYHPDSSMLDVIVNSDNVGMSFVAEKMGKDKLISYLKKFGIGEKTGIDLQGESTPTLRNEKDWSEVDLVTAGFGQGIAVTPIQMARSVAAIANDGIMLKPKVVNSVLVGGNEKRVETEKGERIISENSAKKMTAMMVEAAANGESKWTYQKGFRVAGKTGTAQIPISGHYDSEKTIASFVGFAPYDDPKFVMLVILKEPKSSPWASETAAPLWYAIAKDLFLYFGIQPDR